MLKKLKIEVLAIGVIIAIISFLVLLTKTSFYQASPEQLSVGILLDLVITIPVIYFLLIRKTKIPTFSTLYVFLFGLLLAGFIIPSEQQELVSRIQQILIPLVEVGILVVVIKKIRSLTSTYQSNKKESSDFYDNLLIACNEIFPNRIGRILATEISVFYYLFSFENKKECSDTAFTYFEKSGIKTVISVLLFLLMIETFVVHLFVSKYYPSIAWILTLLGIYAGLQIVAILRSLNKRLITIDEETNTLHLRYGFACQTSIPLPSIEKIVDSRKSFSADKGNIHLSVFDLLDTHNLTIFLNQQHTLYKIYGIKKDYTSISLHLDEKALFIDQLNKCLKSIES